MTDETDKLDNIVPIGLGNSFEQSDVIFPYTGPLVAELFEVHGALEDAGFKVTLEDKTLKPMSFHVDYGRKILRVNCMRAYYALRGLARVAQLALRNDAIADGVYLYTFEEGEQMLGDPVTGHAGQWRELYLTVQRVEDPSNAKPKVAPLTPTHLQMAVILGRTGTPAQRAEAQAFFNYHFQYGALAAIKHMLAEEE